MVPYVVLDKVAGETPLQVLEAYRAQHPELTDVPMAYAGRLDPMASGKLLVLLGEECKRQKNYHALDKAYTIEVLFGLSSDTGDILGRLNSSAPPALDRATVARGIRSLPQQLTLPYPRFSAKTVAGTPLHVWTLSGRLDEITIPEHTTTLYRCRLESYTHIKASDLYTNARARIDRLPTVTESSKALGADFRRDEVRADWEQFRTTYSDTAFPVATLHCIASSGTYMRSLAEYLANSLGTHGLAYSIHRDTIGTYQRVPLLGGFWRHRYT